VTGAHSYGGSYSSHVVPSLQQAAAQRFEEGLQTPDETFTENVTILSPVLLWGEVLG